MQHKKVKVILIAAHTIDGFIARERNELIDWTSKEDKQFFRSETTKAGVVVMGQTTYETFKRPLPNRLNIVLTKDIKKLTVRANKLGYTNVEFINLAPSKVVEAVAAKGFTTVFLCGGSYTYTTFLKNKLVDELWFTIEPLIFGKGLSCFTDSVYNVSCKLLNVTKLATDSIQVKYKVIYSK